MPIRSFFYTFGLPGIM